MSSIPTNPDALLLREQTSQALKESGYPVETSTLATKASRGGGPRFRKFGARVLYRWGDALAWAQAKMSAPRHSSSESDALKQAAGDESSAPSSAATRSLKPSGKGKATARHRLRQRNRAETEVTA